MTTPSWPLVNADWNFWPDHLDPAEIWHTCADLGFDAMEVGVYRADDEFCAANIAAIEALVRETGVGVHAVLFSMPTARWPEGGLAASTTSAQAVTEMAEAARRAADLGAQVFGIWPGADRPMGAADAWARTVDAVQRLADVALGLSLKVAVEYKPGQLLAGATEALRLAEEIDRQGVGVLLDTAHAFAGGEDVAGLPGLLGAHLIHVHLGDASDDDADADLPPGAAHDFVPFLAGLAASRYSGALSFDLYGSVEAGLATGTDASDQSLNYIRGALGQGAS